MVTVEILAATKKYILIILYPVNTLMVKGSHQIPRCNIKKKYRVIMRINLCYWCIATVPCKGRDEAKNEYILFGGNKSWSQ